MSESFTITLQYSDYLAANVLYQRKYWLWLGLLKVMGLGSTLFFALMLGLKAIDQPLTAKLVAEQAIAGVLYGLGLTVFIPLLSLAMIPKRAKRTFEALSLGLSASYQLDDKGFRAANAQSTSNLTWNDLLDFVQDDRLLLLRRTRTMFFPLPKSQLSAEQLNRVLGLLRAAGVREG